MTNLADDNEIDLNGIYLVNNGNIGEHNILVNGSIPKSGRLLYENNELISGTLQFDDYVALIYENQIKVKKGTFDLQILPYEQQTQENKPDGLYNSGYDKGRLLYRGYNPNNYIWLDENGDTKKQDEELYRIISFENDNTIKVIRNDGIWNNTKLPWDIGEDKNFKIPGTNEIVNLYSRKYIENVNENNSFCKSGTAGCGVWGNQTNTFSDSQTLDEKLGYVQYKYYANSKGAMTYYFHSGTVHDDASLNILLNQYWIKSLNTKLTMNIVEHAFYVGGIYPSKKADNEDLQFKRELEEQNSYTWNGKVGLMNATDLIESSTNSNCTSVWRNCENNNDNSDLKTSGNWPCKYDNGNWLDKDGEYWTITPYLIHERGVWGVKNHSFSGLYNAYFYRKVYPTFYLSYDIVFYGEGTEYNPYVIENF